MAEIAVAPAPRTVAPVQAANVRAAIRVAINRSPEVDVARIAVLVDLPIFGDDLGVSQQVVKNTGVQDGNLARLKFLAELVALDDLAVFLVRREVELDLGEIEFELTFANVFLDRPLVLLPRLRHAVARKVDDVLDNFDDGIAAHNMQNMRE